MGACLSATALRLAVGAIIRTAIAAVATLDSAFHQGKPYRHCECACTQVDDEMIFMNTADPASDALLTSPQLPRSSRRGRGMWLPGIDQPAGHTPMASAGMDAHMMMYASAHRNTHFADSTPPPRPPPFLPLPLPVCSVVQDETGMMPSGDD